MRSASPCDTIANRILHCDSLCSIMGNRVDRSGTVSEASKSWTLLLSSLRMSETSRDSILGNRSDQPQIATRRFDSEAKIKLAMSDRLSLTTKNWHSSSGGASMAAVTRSSSFLTKKSNAGCLPVDVSCSSRLLSCCLARSSSLFASLSTLAYAFSSKC